ncbi:MAG: thioredoxin family protein [Caldilineales bacterium]|nr:thioredoxin family protein [Caldilineales bacterium]
MSNLQIGDSAIQFNLPGVDGRSHALSDYGDKNAVAVIFSCNHCPYVLAWEDRMIAIQQDYAAQGVQLIAIGANDAVKYPTDSFDAMKTHAAEKGLNFPYLRDESQEIATAYGAQRTPEIFLFDQAGELRYHGAIDDNYDDPDGVQQTYLRSALDAVLASQAPAIAETPPVGCTIKWK